MRYELENGYICKVFFGCMSGSCTEYTGTVPEGYETLEDWACNANIQAYKIVDGNLVFDEARNTELEKKLDLQRKKILWQGEWYMKESQTAMLSETVSSQLNGIVLVWSQYEDSANKAYDSRWNYTFVPKTHVQIYNGGGLSCVLGAAGFATIGNKYVYVRDDRIVGYVANDQSGVTNGITWNNKAFVLRYVLGV